MISIAKAAANPAGHYSRPDATRLMLNKTPGDCVINFTMPGTVVVEEPVEKTEQAARAAQRDAKAGKKSSALS